MNQFVMAERPKKLGPDQSYTIDSAHELASIYLSERSLAKAEDMYQQVLRGYHKAPLSALVLVKLLYTLNALRILCHRQGKLPESNSMYLGALADSKAVLEINHLIRLQIYRNLGFLYFDQGKLAEAEATFQGPQGERRWCSG